MKLPKKIPSTDFRDDLDEDAQLMADFLEAPPSGDDWLAGIEDDGLPPVELEQIPENAPLVATWWHQHQRDQQDAWRTRIAAELEGPHAEVWRYHRGIEAEVARLSAAARDTAGPERESNLRQLRDTEADLGAFRATPEFRAALAFMLGRLDEAIARAGESVTAEPAAAREWYQAHRARMVALLPETTACGVQESSIVPSALSAPPSTLLDGLASAASPPANAAQKVANSEPMGNELTMERRERLKARAGELKASGVKAWLKTLAKEERVSVSRIKQLLSAGDKPASVDPKSIVGQIGAIHKKSPASGAS